MGKDNLFTRSDVHNLSLYPRPTEDDEVMLAKRTGSGGIMPDIERNLSIYEGFIGGATYKELAEEYGVSRQRIGQLIHKVRLRLINARKENGNNSGN